MYKQPDLDGLSARGDHRKLGAHSRQESAQRARAIGLLTAPSRRP